VDDIRAAILAHSTPPVVGVGHSLGAVITFLAAAKYPDLFSQIVLMDPVIFPTWLLAVFKVTKWLHMTRFNPLAVGARRRKKVFASPEEAYRRFSSGRGMFATWSDDYIRAYCTHGLGKNNDGTAVLKCNPETEAQIYESVLQDIWTYPASVKCPTLIIRGGSSTTFLAGAANRLERKLKHGRLVTVPDTTHFVPMEKPEACHKAIMDFIG
jgi:pimeloyl-ACP methyl ester carboxylesterase